VLVEVGRGAVVVGRVLLAVAVGRVVLAVGRVVLAVGRVVVAGRVLLVVAVGRVVVAVAGGRSVLVVDPGTVVDAGTVVDPGTVVDGIVVGEYVVEADGAFTSVTAQDATAVSAASATAATVKRFQPVPISRKRATGRPGCHGRDLPGQGYCGSTTCVRRCITHAPAAAARRAAVTPTPPGERSHAHATACHPTTPIVAYTTAQMMQPATTAGRYRRSDIRDAPAARLTSVWIPIVRKLIVTAGAPQRSTQADARSYPGESSHRARRVLRPWLTPSRPNQ